MSEAQTGFDFGAAIAARKPVTGQSADGSVLQQFNALRPAGGFGLIMADPPWLYENWSKPGEHKNATAKYNCEPLAWIEALPVRALAGGDCLLWLWATNPMLPAAISVVEKWGFQFKTAGTWCKRTKHGKDAFGTGYLLRSSNEPFLIATIGSPKIARSPRSTVATYQDGSHIDTWPKSSITIEGQAGEHSVKPHEAYAAAEAMMPDAHRIEVFSRTNRAGWSVWGDEAGKLGSAS